MIKDNALVLGGAIVGAAVGYLAFEWVSAQGFYGLVLPGGLAGLGAAIAKTRSKIVPVVCGLIGLAAGLYTEWRFHPFLADGSMGYFAAHLGDLRPITLIDIALGTIIAGYVPFRRGREAGKTVSG